MRTINDVVAGPVTLLEDLCLNGTIAGDGIVTAGTHLELNGTITGDLTVKAGGKVALHGTLSGALVNYGRCNVWGVVQGPILDEDQGLTRLHPGAIHSSDIST